MEQDCDVNSAVLLREENQNEIICDYVVKSILSVEETFNSNEAVKSSTSSGECENQIVSEKIVSHNIMKTTQLNTVDGEQIVERPDVGNGHQSEEDVNMEIANSSEEDCLSGNHNDSTNILTRPTSLGPFPTTSTSLINDCNTQSDCHKRRRSPDSDDSFAQPSSKKTAFGPSRADFGDFEFVAKPKYKKNDISKSEDTDTSSTETDCSESVERDIKRRIMSYGKCVSSINNKNGLLSPFTFERGWNLISFVDEPFTSDYEVCGTLNRVINTINEIFLTRKTNQKQFDNEIDMAVIRLMVLEEYSYKGLHKELPDMMKRIMNSLERTTKFSSVPHIVNQLSPFECAMVNQDLLSKKCRFVKFELAKQFGPSPSVNCNFYFDIKFMFIGRTQRIGSIVSIIPTNTFGQYLNDSIYTLYDYVYDVVNREVEREQSKAQTNDASLLERLAHSDSEDIASLRQMMANIVLPLTKRDYRIQGTSGGQNASDNKLQFTFVSEDGTISTTDTIEEDKEAIFITSYIRPRILTDGSLCLQIYTRKALVLSSFQSFIKDIPEDNLRLKTLVEHVKRPSLRI